MAHAELFMDVHGRYRWLAFHSADRVEASSSSFRSAEEAYADAMRLPLTIVDSVREGDSIRQVSVDEAIAIHNEDGATQGPIDFSSDFQHLRARSQADPAQDGVEESRRRQDPH